MNEKKQYHFYAMLSRMKNIHRWGLMRNTKPENLCEHSFETAVLAHALAVLRNERFGGKADADRVAAAALFHDSSEIITGDLPTPVKYHNEELKKAYKEMENLAEERLMALLPEDLQEVYEPLFRPDEETRELIKAADKLSALIKCIEERNMGNREFLAAEQSTRAVLEQMNLPEVRVFLEQFTESYSLPLDQQK